MKTFNPDNFKTNLRAARLAAGLSQFKLAKLFGNHQDANTVAHWESGRRFPRMESLAILSIILNVTTDYLIGFENNDN